MKLNSLFTDHAVLQRDISVPVWGSTLPNIKIRAEIAGITTRTIASPSGFFTLRFPPLPVGGPYTLSITSNDKNECVRIEDVMVGEVWVCSGQSNMEFPLSRAYADPEPSDSDAIRMITVPKVAPMGRQSDFAGKWQTCTIENAQTFSAVGYFFAKRLHAELKVPVGMIHSSWGGARIEAWTSRESLVKSPITAQMVTEYEANIARDDYWGKAASPPNFPLDPGNMGEEKGWAKPEFNETAWSKVNLPASFAQCQEPTTNGSFWFRKTVQIPSTWVGKELLVHIGSADKHDVTYFNGTKIGATGTGLEEQYWAQPRHYSVSSSLNTSDQVSVAIRVWSFAFAGGLGGPGNEMRIELATGSNETVSLAGEWLCKIEHDVGLTPSPSILHLPGNQNSPYTLYDGMINPLLPYGIRGAIWYQGESNASVAKDYKAYFEAQDNLITDWRHAWGQGDFPFICVQLANYTTPSEYDPASTWVHIREAQLKTTRECLNTGMASAIDIGDAGDIHPRNKQVVGLRLAQWALAKTYNQNVVPNGPHYAGYTIEGDKIRVRFTDVGSGLLIQDPKSRIKTCFIADASRTFVRAEATIEGDTLLVSTADVKAPQAVRYAWSDNPEGCNLYNADGLPASPFRTDTW